MPYPDFIIAGFPRCGTTALVMNLNENNEIFVCLQEANYFNTKNKTLSGYLSLFKPHKINGEKTALYVHENSSIKKMKLLLPNAKIILCVRHPIQMLHSFYNLKTSDFVNRENLPWSINPDEISFSDLILKDIETKKVSNECGFFMKYIRNLLKYYQRENIYIIIQERMFDNIPNEINKVFKFIGAKTLKKRKYKKFIRYDQNMRYEHINYSDKNYKKAIRKLLKLYKPWNKRLYKFLGEKISEWEEQDRFYENISVHR